METESAGQAGACMDFDLVFDFDEEHMVHSLNSQMTSIHPQNETAANLCGDNVELGSPAGLTQPQLPRENPNLNLSQHAYNTYENPGPSVVNAPSLPQSVPSSFNATLVGEPQPYPPSMVGLVAPDNGALHSFQAEHETNLIYSNQQMNIQPEIVTPFEHMPMPQSMGPFIQSSKNNQMVQNISNNNFSSLSQQPSVGPTLFPQNTIEADVMNQRQLPINQHQASLLPSIQNAPYRQLTQLGHQSNEFMNANVYDPQYFNHMQPQAYTPLRPQQLTNQLQLNQVQQMQNVFDPQYQYSMLPSMPVRPRSYVYPQVNQVTVPSNMYDPQVYNPMLTQDLSISVRPSLLGNHQQQLNQVWTTQNSILPGSSMPSRLQQSYGRQQPNQLATLMPNMYTSHVSSSMLQEPIMFSGSPYPLDHYEQANQVSMSPFASNLQQRNSITAGSSIQPWAHSQRLYDFDHQHEQVQNSKFCSSMLPQPSMLSRSQQSSEYQQLNKFPEMASRVDPSHDKILHPQSSMTSSLQNIQTQGLQNQTARQSLSYLSPGTQQTQSLNSQSQREIGSLSKEPVPLLRETLSVGSYREKGLVEGLRSAAKRNAYGESLLTSKRSRTESVSQERSLSASNPQEEEKTSGPEGTEVENPNDQSPKAKKLNNSLYDPNFEGIGVPVDPHLRLFGSGNGRP
ncbi:hypothetical protein RGQ29_008737 [Quercus rubra]|uniref:Uncharacterized protein n=1 Tax=Quercus rubra TaxID=3512 RepID=A0AAN7E1J4_QUERU|nr:hypothetical protein RGQ29_008737 [Quercus rubra]